MTWTQCTDRTGSKAVLMRSVVGGDSGLHVSDIGKKEFVWPEVIYLLAERREYYNKSVALNSGNG